MLSVNVKHGMHYSTSRGDAQIILSWTLLIINKASPLLRNSPPIYTCISVLANVPVRNTRGLKREMSLFLLLDQPLNSGADHVYAYINQITFQIPCFFLALMQGFPWHREPEYMMQCEVKICLKRKHCITYDAINSLINSMQEVIKCN